jgi:hypothetical protein
MTIKKLELVFESAATEPLFEDVFTILGAITTLEQDPVWYFWQPNPISGACRHSYVLDVFKTPEQRGDKEAMQPMSPFLGPVSDLWDLSTRLRHCGISFTQAFTER